MSSLKASLRNARMKIESWQKLLKTIEEILLVVCRIGNKNDEEQLIFAFLMFGKVANRLLKRKIRIPKSSLNRLYLLQVFVYMCYENYIFWKLTRKRLVGSPLQVTLFICSLFNFTDSLISLVTVMVWKISPKSYS